QDVIQLFKLNSAVHAQLRSGRLWQLPFKRRIDRECPVLRGRVDPDYFALNDAVSSIDRDVLTKRYVLDLSLGDLQFGLQLVRVGNRGDRESGSDLLADFDKQKLKNTVDACSDLELFNLLSPERGILLKLVGLLLLRFQFCLNLLAPDAESLLFDLVSGFEVSGL